MRLLESKKRARRAIESAILTRKLDPYYSFLADTIDEHKLTTTQTGISLNILFSLRLILLEVMMIALQVTPLLQILIINMINMGYLLWTIKAIFVEKSLESTLDKVHRLILEISIQVFLLATFVFWVNENGDLLSTVFSVVVQMFCLLCIGLAVVVELVMVAVNTCRSISASCYRKQRVRDYIRELRSQLFHPGGAVRAGTAENRGINFRGVKRMKRGGVANLLKF